jgi:glycosidase
MYAALSTLLNYQAMKIMNYMFEILFAILLFSCGKKTAVTAPVTPEVKDSSTLQYGTPFNNVPAREDAVIYQVNMRTFSAAGNFAGVIPRLDSIKALGANVIYLMPVHPVGIVNGVNSPYCVRDYKAVNTEFGTLNDLRLLVDGAHSRNMSVIMDWVANHTAFDNAWITTHKDWYLQNAAGNIISPPGTGWNDVAQLNFSNAAMRLEMIKSMKYWVYAANIDGFRCDYTDGPPLDFWKQAIDTLRNISTHKLLLMAEGSRTTNFTVGFDYNFGFGFFGSLKTVYNNQPAIAFDNSNTNEYFSAANGQQVVRYTSNHDVNGSDGTPEELFGGQPGAMGAFVIAAYMKSIPMIYAGQEVATPYRLLFPFTQKDIDWNINPGVTAEYKKIIALRNNNAAIRKGILTSYTTADVCAFVKELGTKKVLVLVNVRNSAIHYTVPPPIGNTTWNDGFSGNTVTVTNQIILQPFQYTVLLKD